MTDPANYTSDDIETLIAKLNVSEAKRNSQASKITKLQTKIMILEKQVQVEQGKVRNMLKKKAHSVVMEEVQHLQTIIADQQRIIEKLTN